MPIQQLAKHLGLSVGTVSRALNDRPGVSSITQTRIKATAIEMECFPNRIGRSLRMHKTGTIATVIPQSSAAAFNANAIFFDIMNGFRGSLAPQGIETRIMACPETADPLDFLHNIIERRIADGIVICRLAPNDIRIPFLRDAGIDFAAFGRSAGHYGFDWVDYDFFHAAEHAAQVLFDAGHRKIGFLMNNHPLNYFDIISAGARTAAANLGMSPSVVQEYRLFEDSVDAQCIEARTAPDAPSAWIALNEGFTSAFVRACQACDRPVGQKTALIRIMASPGNVSAAQNLSHFVVDHNAVGEELAKKFRRDLPPDRKPLSSLIPMTFVPGTSHIISAT